MKDHAISIFNRHNQEVIERILEDRLLVYQPGEGWERLCRFLNVTVPSEPFPHMNGTASFRRDILGIEDPATEPAV